MSPHVFAFERRLPAWIRPTCRGAVCCLGLGRGVVGTLYVTALIAVLMLLVGPRHALVLFGWIVAVAMVAGAVGGTIHGLLRGLEQRGRPGLWWRWVGTLLGVGACAVLLTPQGPFRVGEVMTWVVAVVIAGLGAAGLVLWDGRRPGRLTAHQFQWLEDRDQRWATMRRPAPGRPPEVATVSEAIDEGPAVSRAARWWGDRRRPAASAAAGHRDASQATEWVGDS